jgi:hypothetical protein
MVIGIGRGDQGQEIGRPGGRSEQNCGRPQLKMDCSEQSAPLFVGLASSKIF